MEEQNMVTNSVIIFVIADYLIILKENWSFWFFKKDGLEMKDYKKEVRLEKERK